MGDSCRLPLNIAYFSDFFNSLVMPWPHLCGPRSILQHDAITIKVLKRLPLDIPIRIIRWDAAKSGRKHVRTAFLPLIRIRNVEYQQMIFGGRIANLVSSLRGELDM